MENVEIIREQQLLRLLIPLLSNADPQVHLLATTVVAQCIRNKFDEAVARHTGALPLFVTMLRSQRAALQTQALKALAMATQTGMPSFQRVLFNSYLPFVFD